MALPVVEEIKGNGLTGIVSEIDIAQTVEIHDILRVQGFNWLSNGNDSCLIKKMNR